MTSGNGARQVVVVILAIGLATALNLITLASLWIAVHGKSDVTGGLSENATQVLTGVFGGIIGVLGSYMGFKAGEHASSRTNDEGVQSFPRSDSAPPPGET